MIASLADTLAQWPNIAIVLSVVAVLVALLFGAQRLGRRLLPADGAEARAIAALDTFKVLGPLAGVFLSFSLVQGISQFRTADVDVSREASNIYQLDRALGGVPQGQDARTARLALRDYVRRILSDEWPALRAGQTDALEAIRALQALQRSIETLVDTFPPDLRMSNDIDANFDQIQDDRAVRLGIAHGGLPAVMWWVLAMLLCLLFACAACLQGSAARHPLPVLYVAGLGLLAALLFIIDRPFQGELSVSPAPIAKVLGQLEGRMR